MERHGGQAGTALRPLVVMHLPKTGGTTLRHVVASAAAQERVVSLYTGDEVEAFLAADATVRHTTDVVVGHVRYGIHRWLPATTRYVTILREPVARAVSEYRYVASHVEHTDHAEARTRGLVGFTAWLAERGRANPQTGALVRPGLTDDRPVTTADVPAALDRLGAHFAFVGLTERFDESVAAICVVAGWDPPRFLDRNVTPGRSAPDAVAAGDRDVLAELHAADVALYEAVRAEFDAAVAALGPAHERAVVTLRRRNGLTWRSVRRGVTLAASARHRARRALGRR